jgi:CRP-like cAMP-binding protein
MLSREAPLSCDHDQQVTPDVRAPPRSWSLAFLGQRFKARAATAVALTDVDLVPVGEKQFLFLVSQTPQFALNVMRVLARRLRAVNAAI